MVGSWRLVAAGGWQRLVAGGWWRLVVGSRWRLAVDGSWRLAVGGPLGRSLRAVLSKKKKKISSLKDAPAFWAVNSLRPQSGWGRLLSGTNAVEAGSWRQGDSGWGWAWRPGGGMLSRREETQGQAAGHLRRTHTRGMRSSCAQLAVRLGHSRLRSRANWTTMRPPGLVMHQI